MNLINCIEPVPLKCDELERQFEYNDIYCTVTNMQVTHSQEVKMTIYSNSQIINIKFMKFYDSILLYIPHKLFEIFQNLKNLDISYSHIIDIPRNTFSSANMLSYLNASHNNITEINSSVFIGATNLQRIDLSYNQIQNIDMNAFKGLTQLDRLALSSNHIKFLNQTLFDDNLYLESISIDNNLIENIEPELFIKLTRLRDIDLTNNQLKSIDSTTFQNSYILESIMLSGNQLTEYNLETKNQIQTLNIDNNHLKTLILNSTKYVRASNNEINSITIISSMYLEKLYLSNNNLNNIMNITNFTNLIILDLSYNYVGNISVETFSKLKRLKYLNLRKTMLNGIDYGTFSKQNNLEYLDLSENNLNFINMDIFVPYLMKLQEFYIDGNNLTQINGKMSFSYAFPVMTTIGLTNNNFNCSYLHHILSPPYLSTFVKLHIPTNLTNDGRPHIRGISCNSDQIFNNQTNQINDTDFINDNNFNRLTKDTIMKLKLHEKQLEQHLLLMKIFIGLISITLLCFVIYKLIVITTEKRESLIRSIAYRSTATVNTIQTHMEHD